MFLIFCRHAARYYLRHKMLALLNILGIALGVAVFVSVQIVNYSALQSFRASIDIVSGKANLEIVGNGLPFKETLYPNIRTLPGVIAATPLVETVATPVSAPGEYLQILGLDIFSNGPFRTFTLQEGNHTADPLAFLGDPSAIAITKQMAIRLHLKLGDKMLLRTDTGTREYTIASLISFNEDAVGINEHLAVMDLSLIHI